jgi:hypothetical protein
MSMVIRWVMLILILGGVVLVPSTAARAGGTGCEVGEPFVSTNYKLSNPEVGELDVRGHRVFDLIQGGNWLRLRMYPPYHVVDASVETRTNIWGITFKRDSGGVLTFTSAQNFRSVTLCIAPSIAGAAAGAASNDNVSPPQFGISNGVALAPIWVPFSDLWYYLQALLWIEILAVVATLVFIDAYREQRRRQRDPDYPPIRSLRVPSSGRPCALPEGGAHAFMH